VDRALQELLKRSPEEALALFEALHDKRKAENYIKYWTPQPQQSKHFPLWTPDIKIFGILGGNRSGKTDEGAAIVTAAALGKDYFRDEPAWEWVQHLPFKNPPLNIWCVGLDLNVLWDVIWGEKFLRGRTHPGFIPSEALFKKPSEAEPVIYLANGTVITGKSAESGREKFQSASVDLVWIDEEPEVEIFDECYQRTADCSGKILLTLTPLTDIASGVRTPWVHDLYTKWRTKQVSDVQFVSLSVLDNPYVPEIEKKKLMEKWAGHPEERARLYGDFVQRSGMVYKMWDPAVHMIRPRPLPRDWPSVVVIDPAPTGPTAALMGRIAPNNDLYLTKEYKQANLVVSEHAKNIIVRMAGDPVDIWGIDPKGGSQRNAETHATIADLYKKSGIPCRLLDLPEDYGMAASQEYMNATVTLGARHPKIYVFNDLHQFRDEIEHYTWATFGKGELKGQSKEKPVKKNDHLMNCFQYMAALRLKGNRASARTFDSEAYKQERENFARVNSYT
jgi:phage terminase large subunit-like protein